MISNVYLIVLDKKWSFLKDIELLKRDFIIKE